MVMKTFPASWACHTHNCALHSRGLFRIVALLLIHSGSRIRQHCGFFVSVLHRSFRMATGFHPVYGGSRALNTTPSGNKRRRLCTVVEARRPNTVATIKPCIKQGFFVCWFCIGKNRCHDWRHVSV
nr:MAG TPA: hypothetical protein [Caudoviricetes sp.]